MFAGSVLRVCGIFALLFFDLRRLFTNKQVNKFRNRRGREKTSFFGGLVATAAINIWYFLVSCQTLQDDPSSASLCVCVCVRAREGFIYYYYSFLPKVERKPSSNQNQSAWVKEEEEEEHSLAMDQGWRGSKVTHSIVEKRGFSSSTSSTKLIYCRRDAWKRQKIRISQTLESPPLVDVSREGRSWFFYCSPLPPPTNNPLLFSNLLSGKPKILEESSMAQSTNHLSLLFLRNSKVTNHGDVFPPFWLVLNDHCVRPM